MCIRDRLYMVKPGFGEKIRQFVANGGTVIGTYLLGYVNDSTPVSYTHLDVYKRQRTPRLWSMTLSPVSPLLLPSNLCSYL